jgi:hypothetical protein
MPNPAPKGFILMQSIQYCFEQMWQGRSNNDVDLLVDNALCNEVPGSADKCRVEEIRIMRLEDCYVGTEVYLIDFRYVRSEV